MAELSLKPLEKEIMLEIANAAINAVPQALAVFIQGAIRARPPEVELQRRESLSGMAEKGLFARILFLKGLAGEQCLFFPGKSAASLAALLLGKEAPPSPPEELTEMESSALSEAVGMIMGVYTTSLAAFLGSEIAIDAPQIAYLALGEGIGEEEQPAAAENWVVIHYLLEVEEVGELDFFQLVPHTLMREVIAPLLPPGAEAAGDGEGQGEAEALPEPGLEELFSPLELDTLAEVGTISLGSSSTALSHLLNQRVQITAPRFFLKTVDRLWEQFPGESIITRVNYTKGLEGENIFILNQNDAAVIAALMMGLPPENPAPIGEMELSAVSEAMNQMMGSAATALSVFLGRDTDITPPRVAYSNLQQQTQAEGVMAGAEPVLQVAFSLEIGDLLQSQFWQIMPVSFARKITSQLLQGLVDGEKEAAAARTPRKEQEALLAEGGDRPAEKAGAPAEGTETLSALQKDALAEVGNISLGSSATALSKILNRRVQITTPHVTLTTMGEVRANYPTPCLVVTVNYIEGLAGHNILILSEDDALAIVGLMLGMEPPERPPELGELEISGISEAMNQMMGATATSMSDMFHRLIDISPPLVERKNLHTEKFDLAEMEDHTPVVQIAFRIEVEDLLDSKLLQLVPLDFAREISGQLLAGVGMAGQGGEAEAGLLEDLVAEGLEQFREQPGPAGVLAEEGSGPEKEGKEGEDEAGMFADLEAFTRALAAEAPAPEEAEAKTPARIWQERDYSRIDMIRDIPVHIYVLLGKTRLPLKRIFSIYPGEVIALDRYLGEPVDVYANDLLVAKGEVVLVNGQFGFKIIDMVKP